MPINPIYKWIGIIIIIGDFAILLYSIFYEQVLAVSENITENEHRLFRKLSFAGDF